MLSIGTSAFEYNKIRMQLEYLIAVKQGVVYEPKGTFRGFREIYGAGGIKGLYTGFRLHAARDTLVSSIVQQIEMRLNGAEFAGNGAVLCLLRRWAVSRSAPRVVSPDTGATGRDNVPLWVIGRNRFLGFHLYVPVHPPTALATNECVRRPCRLGQGESAAKCPRSGPVRKSLVNIPTTLEQGVHEAVQRTRSECDEVAVHTRVHVDGVGVREGGDYEGDRSFPAGRRCEIECITLYTSENSDSRVDERRASKSSRGHGTIHRFVDSSRWALLHRNHDTCLAAVPRSAMESSLRAPLDRIPPELVTVILSHLPLETLLAVSRTSRALRTHVATEPTVWSRPLHIAAVDAGVSFTASALNAPHSPDASDLLAVLPSFDLVPNLELVRLIPTLSRFFLLYKAELPRLTNDEWKEICQARFMESVMRTARERGGPSAGYWRRVFLKTINSYEHTMQTGCSVENHMVSPIFEIECWADAWLLVLLPRRAQEVWCELASNGNERVPRVGCL
jgi:hypothetical protein